MSGELRATRARTVSVSLDNVQEFRSDQRAIWNGIDRMAEAASIRSPTGAMADIFKAKQEEMEGYLDTFSCVPSQKGLLVFVNGRVVGFDILSSSAAYELLHPKLLKSYVMDALLHKAKSRVKITLDTASAFIGAIQSCTEKKFKSAGLGWDHRFEGKMIVGSSLVNDDHCCSRSILQIGPIGSCWLDGRLC